MGRRKKRCLTKMGFALAGSLFFSYVAVSNWDGEVTVNFVLYAASAVLWSVAGLGWGTAASLAGRR